MDDSTASNFASTAALLVSGGDERIVLDAVTGQSRYGNGQILSVAAVRKDGTRVSVEFTIVPFTDNAGRMIGIAAIMRDATARFEELRALRRQLALHSAANP